MQRKFSSARFARTATRFQVKQARLRLQPLHHGYKQDIFEDHELGVNERVFEEDHKSALIKLGADKYLTLRIFTYGKRYQESVVTKGQPSDGHKLTKSILFKNQ